MHIEAAPWPAARARPLVHSLAFGLITAACASSPEPAFVPRPLQTVSPRPQPESPVGAGVTEPPPEQDLAALAEAAWQRRHERESLEEAISSWERLAERRPRSTAVWTHLAHAYFLLADGHMTLAGETDHLAMTFDRGAAAGALALLTSSEEVEARLAAGEPLATALDAVPPAAMAAVFWYAANLDRLAVWEGVTPLLLYADQTQAMMQHVLEVDERLFYAGPHRYYGIFYAEAPVFAGGDLGRSRTHFERAIELGGDYLANKVAYAAHYAVKAEKRELFVRLLQDVIAADAGAVPEVAAEQQLEQEKARSLLARVEQLF